MNGVRSRLLRDAGTVGDTRSQALLAKDNLLMRV